MRSVKFVSCAGCKFSKPLSLAKSIPFNFTSELLGHPLCMLVSLPGSLGLGLTSSSEQILSIPTEPQSSTFYLFLSLAAQCSNTAEVVAMMKAMVAVIRV